MRSESRDVRAATWVDGTLFSHRDGRVPAVPALGFGHLYGDGVFETVVLADGRPFRLHAHVDRLIAGAGYLGLPGLPARPRLHEAIQETLEAADVGSRGILRITATRGPGSAGRPLSTDDCSRSSLVVHAVSAPPVSKTPVRACRVGVRHPDSLPPVGIKSTSYQGTIVGLGIARDRGFDSGVWTDGAGNLTEALTANLFAVVDGVLLTPPDDKCLPGITRRCVLDLAASSGIEARIADLPFAEVAGWREAFLTSSIAGIRPLRTLEEQPLPLSPGPVTTELARAYAKLVEAGDG